MGRRGNTPGRLLREENPQSGTVPGFTPQYFEDDRYPREVSEDYPYPVKDAAVESRLQAIEDRLNETQAVADESVEERLQAIESKMSDTHSVSDSSAQSELETIKQTQNEILERLNEPLDTKVTGRNFEVLRIFSTDSTAWRSFADEMSSGGVNRLEANEELDVSSYSERSIVIRNDTDGTIDSLRVRSHLVNDDGSFMVLSCDIESVPAMSRKTITSDDIPQLNDPHVLQLQLRANLSANEGQYHVAFAGKV